jgi:hypothetical protein
MRVVGSCCVTACSVADNRTKGLEAVETMAAYDGVHFSTDGHANLVKKNQLQQHAPSAVR